MKKLKVLLLVHEDLMPPEEAPHKEINEADWKTEYDVREKLRDYGHSVEMCGLHANVDVLRKALEEFKPDIVFNLLEEFDGNATYDHNIVSYLELRRFAYTGCNPRGLMLARDKALSKKILNYHRIPTPKFQIASRGKKIKLAKHMNYPVIVKSLVEEASLGISQASVVNSADELSTRVQFIHEQIGTDAILEEFIDGREFYVGVWGNSRIATLPVWELKLNKLRESGASAIATSKVKWSTKYRAKYKIHSRSANVSDELRNRLSDAAKKCYKRLGLNGYARIDLRSNANENVFIIEANPNPGIAWGEEFSEAAEASGSDYTAMLNKVLALGLKWHANRS